MGGVLTSLLSPRAAFAVSGGGVLAVLLVAGLVLTLRNSAPRTEPAPEPAG
jgi:hypothetical protein